ncbi:DUF4132 domain-containing protein [Streptomyces sp. YU58]|uniref:DUF4132 domain-containing protein n=1 Tax=Streptomyces sp. SX92 TaxID=3158972 RepID=UPI0027BB0DE2|nr:DUF4132 domain-containing protein [Streptomyces coralus]WLW52713.1 DUF4132 domain-containing protein [Streptomyces coralus]
MVDIQTCKELVAQRIAEDDLDALAVELVKTATVNNGNWGGPWTHVLDRLRELPADTRKSLADALVEQYHSDRSGPVARGHVLTLLGIVARDLPEDFLSTERLEKLDELSRQHSFWHGSYYEALAEAELKTGRALAPAVVAVFRRSAMDGYGPASLTGLAARLTAPVLNVGEVWAEQAVQDSAEPDWQALLAHAATATAARPAAKWNDRAAALIDALGADRVRETILPWLALVGRPRTIPLGRGTYEPDHNNAYDPYNANALRGLTWILALLPPHPDTPRALGALVDTSLKKVAGLGPRNPKVANAAVNALARLDGESALAELARLATRVTYKGTRKLLDTALDTRADAMGLSREEIEELAVPAYGLTEVGGAEHRLGDVTALIGVHGTKALLTWRNAAGKPVRTVPASVRRDHADDLKDLKAAVKDIDRMLSAQSERLDRQFLARRTWPYTAWRERYLDHPLVGTLARRLLWTVDGTTVGYADGALRTLTDDPVTDDPVTDEPVPDGREVSLWHPVGHDPAEIVAWRDWLERHEITQPFKQAHREVYLLTDAERTTATYSNRFAAHFLRQHQFHSLAAVRGWHNKLRLSVDDEAPPAVRELPQWGLRAEYWIEGDGGENYQDITESGSFLRLRTDQVRFYPIDAPQNSAHCCGGEYHMWLRNGENPVDPVPLDAVPPLVLSEVLRDVDLFVGVASVGNDPTWQDGGPDGRFREYWTSYGFGALNQSAETRRVLLERLIPRLAIADRCTLEGRFLHVKGERHTYKIHLGSGNITWSYPLTVPSAPAGPAPQISFTYNSQTVDGRTAVSSPQASWIGEGWSYDPGHIERRYRACQDDRKTLSAGAPNNTAKKDKTSDLCWVSYNAVMSLGGKTTDLVRVPTSGSDPEKDTETYRPQKDDGTRIEHRVGGTNDDDNGEYWVVTTTDGTQFYYGQNTVGGGHATTRSVSTVPVFGNHPGEPCHATAFADSRCGAGKQQAWRWGLDKVVDVHGNTMIVNWTQETNYYSVREKFKEPEQYDRYAYPTTIEYGMRPDSLTKPSATVEFGAQQRCLKSATACTAANFAKTDDPGAYRPWWDTPGNLNCKSTSKLCPPFPSFWTQMRLDTVTTKAARAGQTGLGPVDKYTLRQSFPEDWYDTAPGLWLNSITRTGYAPGDTTGTLQSKDGISFAQYTVGSTSPLRARLKDRQLPNLVLSGKSDQRPGFTRPRIGTVSIEYGGDIEVEYTGGCATEPAEDKGKSNSTCYPVRWSPDGDEKTPAKAWFNKYVVDSVTETDKVTSHSKPVVSKYTYSGAAWAKSDDEFSRPALRTYSDWRGYRQVTVTKGGKASSETGVPQPQSQSTTRYFLGTGGEVKDSTNTFTLLSDDAPQYAGMTAETITYVDSDGTILKRNLTYPWSKQTASRARENEDATTADPLLAHRTGIKRSDEIQHVDME